MSGMDWFPTFVTAAGNPNITTELLKGKEINGTTYKVHLDGYDQTPMITGKGPSNRHEIFYFGESSLGAVRIDDYKYQFIQQPDGWLGAKFMLMYQLLQTCVWIHLSECVGPKMVPLKAHRIILAGSSMSSGVLYSSSRLLQSWQ
jgi:hypothetical protein